MTRLWTFTVTGCSDFPVDMLRYDCCWPATGSRNSVAIMASLERRLRRQVDLDDVLWVDGGVRTVTLVGLRPPSNGRWASFSWQVEPGSVKQLPVSPVAA